MNHLHQSPYHDMDKDEAEMQANMAAVETYLEQIGDWTSQKEDDNPATWARKRSREGAAEYTEDQRNAVPMSRESAMAAFKALPVPTFGSQGAAEARINMQADDHVVLNGVQCKAVLDSLKRARIAVQMCEAVAARSVAAFQQERQVINECEAVLATWVNMTTGAPSE